MICHILQLICGSNKLLPSKLTNPGLSSTPTSWFQSYLSNRSQITRVLDSYSSLGFPTFGVPQGTILGPTLFSAFIYNLPSVLPLNSTVLFADDTTIFIVSDNICTLQSSLQTCLNLANLWLQTNGLNTLKTKSMFIHSSRKVTGSTLELSVNGNQVEQVCSFKLLGVTINDTLTWSDHINTVCAKVSRNLNLLHPGFQKKTSPYSYHVQLYVLQVPSSSFSAFSFTFFPLHHPLCFAFPAQLST